MRGQRICAAGDRLRLQRRERPFRGNLGRDDAANIAFEWDPVHGGADQHAHDCAGGGLPDGRAGVVVGEDRLTAPAVLGKAVCPILTHAHAVAIACARDHERLRRCCARGRRGRARREGERRETTDEQRDEWCWSDHA